MYVYILIVTATISNGHLDHKTIEQLQPRMQCAVMQMVGVATVSMNIDTALSRLQI